MGLGVQFSAAEIYSPEQGFLQPAKLNATIIEAQIDRFLSDGKKPPIHKEIRPDIVGLQASKSASLEETPVSPSPPDLPTPSLPYYSEPLEPLEGLLHTDSPEAVSERNSFSFMLLCILGLGLILTLGALYFKGSVAF